MVLTRSKSTVLGKRALQPEAQDTPNKTNSLMSTGSVQPTTTAEDDGGKKPKRTRTVEENVDPRANKENIPPDNTDPTIRTPTLRRTATETSIGSPRNVRSCEYAWIRVFSPPLVMMADVFLYCDGQYHDGRHRRQRSARQRAPFLSIRLLLLLRCLHHPRLSSLSTFAFAVLCALRATARPTRSAVGQRSAPFLPSSFSRSLQTTIKLLCTSRVHLVRARRLWSTTWSEVLQATTFRSYT